MRVDTPIVIVGAGLAGLVTAWELTRVGVACRLLEAIPRVGRRVETAVFGGQGAPDGCLGSATPRSN